MPALSSPSWNLEELAPFGALITAATPESSITTIPQQKIVDLVDQHRVVVFRAFASLDGSALPDYCRTLGTLLEWDFGVVNRLKSSPDAQNYLYTNREVPFHWDGAFAGRIPHYIFFECDAAPDPGAGGETLFTDTSLILDDADAETKTKWRNIDITYSTEKIVHYGGRFTSPLIVRRESRNDEVLRFAEPVTDLNPVALSIDGLDGIDRETFLSDMHRRLNDNRFCYRHSWQSDDIVIADNLILLHGRAAFSADTDRLIRRVNIL
jgi:alpha-ketoglutarate-dependent taurine dioxygenase